jgi:GMP synthase-like glutamine amidotransferase
MTIGILLCGGFPATLEAQFGQYSSMIQRLLGSRCATVFDVRERQLPRSISACEAYVITGSSAGVYDDLPWIKDLMAFLRSARGGAKLIGICFGHQSWPKLSAAPLSNRRRGGESVFIATNCLRSHTGWMTPPP